jgi:hypothetical protein
MKELFKEGVLPNPTVAGRIVAHGEITSLTAGFPETADVPFSILVFPTENITDRLISIPSDAGLLVSCKLAQDSASSDLPVMFGVWTEGIIHSIDIDAIALGTYTVYWGTGGKS